MIFHILIAVLKETKCTGVSHRLEEYILGAQISGKHHNSKLLRQCQLCQHSQKDSEFYVQKVKQFRYRPGVAQRVPGS